MTKEKLLIIDGNNLLFQMFYGMPAKIFNKKGETIHATIGFISSTLRMIKEYKPTKVFVAFDYDASEERLEVYPEYKQNRINDWENMHPNDVPFNEENKIIKCLDYMKIKHEYSKKMEADDLIASLAISASSDIEVIISSFDSDFFQLINENISILRYRGKKSVLYDEKLFYDKYGFTPDKYVFYKSIVGDTSDNIKGIYGIGKENGKKIVNKYFTLFNFLEDKTYTYPKKESRDNDKLRSDIILNENIIKLVKKEIDVDLNELDYNNDILNMTNTQILKENDIFL